jgi:hypothetical protein
LSQSAAYRRFLGRGELRRRRRDRRVRQRPQKKVPELVKLSAEEKRRMEERREYIDAAVSYLSNYSWSYFVTLTFGEQQGAESIDRAIKRFTRFVHQNVFGDFDAASDVRDLYGIRYFPALERGCCGEKRLHAHVLIAGGEVLGERLTNARWTPWRKWWNREYGGLRIEKPRAQGDVAAYCTKYVLKGDDAGFELCSTWADERDRRNRAEAPLLEERKVGIDVTRSAELERAAYRCESPRGTGPTLKGGGKPCRRCGLVSLCRCWSGTSESGQVVDAPEPDAGACESGEQIAKAANPSPLSPQMELRMHEQLAFAAGQASASKSVTLAVRPARRERRRARYHAVMSRSSFYAVVRSSAAFANHVRALA